MIKVDKFWLNDISDELESNNTGKTWIFGKISPENAPRVFLLIGFKI
jgi:hypothetical protein